MDPRDPRFRKSRIPADFIIQKTKKGKDWHWSLTIIILGGLGGGMATYGLMGFTMLSSLHLVLGILAVGTLAFLLQWRHFYNPAFFEKYFRIHISIYALYNYVGIGFLVSALFLSINWLGASDKEVIERHRIVGIDRDYVNDSNYLTVLLLENNAYASYPDLRCAPFNDVKLKTRPFLDIIFNKGLFGVLIHKGQRTAIDPVAILKELNEETTGEIPEITQTVDSTIADTTVVDSINY